MFQTGHSIYSRSRRRGWSRSRPLASLAPSNLKPTKAKLTQQTFPKKLKVKVIDVCSTFGPRYSVTSRPSLSLEKGQEKPHLRISLPGLLIMFRPSLCTHTNLDPNLILAPNLALPMAFRSFRSVSKVKSMAAPKGSSYLALNKAW